MSGRETYIKLNPEFKFHPLNLKMLFLGPILLLIIACTLLSSEILPTYNTDNDDYDVDSSNKDRVMLYTQVIGVPYCLNSRLSLSLHPSRSPPLAR